MRWFLLMGAGLATTAFGTWPSGPTSPDRLSEEFVRLGPSVLASASQSVFSGFASTQLNVGEVRFYVEAVHQPGQVVLAHAGGLSATATVTEPGWVSFAFAPLRLSLYGSFQLTLTPQGGTELTLRHVVHPVEEDHQVGEQEPALVTLKEPARSSGVLWNVSAVLRLPDREDPYASPACAPSERDGVAGFPYVRFSSASLDAGILRTQHFFFPRRISYGGSPLFLDYGELYFDSTTRFGDLHREVHRADGGAVPVLPSQVLATEEPLFFTFDDAGMGEPFDVSVSSDAGGGWLLLDTGAVPLGECDPAVRATFGGHRARAADLPPGADYLLRLRTSSAFMFYVDGDGDSFGDPASWVWHRSSSPGFSYRAQDCDDTRAAVHPDAGEVCNGLDDDCDGLVDSDAPWAPLCELQRGVCFQVRRTASDCVSGAWVDCDATQYGANFHAETCDGLDNDCDGLVDEDVPLACSEQRGVCAGSWGTCSAGVPSCGAANYGPDYEPAEQRCDGIDNDCDGEVDEASVACPSQRGVCAGSMGACVAGSPVCGVAAYGADFETRETRCDGLDNDCDGEIDEGVVLLCPEQRGVCEGMHGGCSNGRADCDGVPPPGFEARELSCDGLDNDCDGLVDANDPDVGSHLCALQLGVCKGSQLTRAACLASGWAPCADADYGPEYERLEITVDGLDNDCDGRIDEWRNTPEPMSASCGCTSAYDGLVLLAGLALVRLRRRAAS